VGGIALATSPATSPATAQERPKGCLIEIWPDFLGPGPQEHQLREKLETDAGEIFAIEFGPLAGEYAKLYLFFLVYDGCERKVFSVGSFNYQTDMARESGSITSTIPTNTPRWNSARKYRATRRCARWRLIFCAEGLFFESGGGIEALQPRQRQQEFGAQQPPEQQQ
jgi:hypothetical protein